MAKQKYRVYRVDGEYTDTAPLTKALSFERAAMLADRFTRKSPHIQFTVKAS